MRSQDGRDLKVLVRKGTNFMAATNVLTNVQGRAHLLMPTNQVYLVQSQVRPTRVVASTNQVFLPGDVALNVSESQSAQGKLYIVPETHLRWSQKDNAYATTLSIGLASTNAPALAKRLLPLAVRFRTDRLHWETNLVRIEEPGIAGEASLRVWSPRFFPQATLYARSELNPEELPIGLTWEKLGAFGFLSLLFPLPVLTAMLLGGATGGALRSFKSERKKRNQWYWLILEGILAGFLLVALVRTGLVILPVSFSPDQLTTLVGALACAGLGGYGGSRFLDKVTENFHSASAEQKP